MKKFLSILIVTLGFTISVSAQEKNKNNSTPEYKAKVDTALLIEATGNNSNMFYDTVYQLFYKKHLMLAKEHLTVNEKNEIRALIEGKLRASFTADEIKKFQDKGIWEGLLQ